MEVMIAITVGGGDGRDEASGGNVTGNDGAAVIALVVATVVGC